MNRDFNGFPIRHQPLPVARVVKRRGRGRAKNSFGARVTRPGLRHRKRIERGLDRILKTAKPGDTFTTEFIAKACRVSPDTISQIEHAALRKLRLKLDAPTIRELRQHLKCE